MQDYRAHLRSLNDLQFAWEWYEVDEAIEDGHEEKDQNKLEEAYIKLAFIKEESRRRASPI